MQKKISLFLLLLFLNNNLYSLTELEIAKQEELASEGKRLGAGFLGFFGGGLGAGLSTYYLIGRGISKNIDYHKLTPSQKFIEDYRNESASFLRSFFGVSCGLLGGILGAVVGYQVSKDKPLIRARRLFILSNLYVDNLSIQEVIEQLRSEFIQTRYPLISALTDLQLKKSLLLRSKNLFSQVLNSTKDKDIIAECNIKLPKIDKHFAYLNDLAAYLLNDASFKNELDMKKLEEAEATNANLRNINLNQSLRFVLR